MQCHLLRSHSLFILLTFTVCVCVVLNIDAHCSVENSGFLAVYRLSVRYLEAGVMVTLLSRRPLSFALSVLPLSLSSKVILLCSNSRRCIFHLWLCLSISIGQRKRRKALSTKEKITIVCLRVMDKVMAIFSSYLLEGHKMGQG